MANHEIVVAGEPAYREYWATGLHRDALLETLLPADDEPRLGELLMVQYDAGDCDTRLRTWKDLYAACYDAHQMYEGWETGDTLSFKGTEFARIESFHVVPTLGTKDAYDQELPV